MIECSFCPKSESVQLLSCCISFVCGSCVKTHLCQRPLKVIPIENSKKSKLSLKCRRCVQRQATTVCWQCKSKQLCKQCSQIIHQQKYKTHQLIPIEIQNINSILSGSKLFQGSKNRNSYSQLKEKSSQNKNQFDSNPQNFDSTKIQLQIYLSNAFKQKTDIERKWQSLRIQTKLVLNRFQLQLQRRNKQIMGYIQENKMTQINLIQNYINQLTINQKTNNTLSILAKNQKGLENLIKQKKILICKTIAKWNKITDLTINKYKIDQDGYISVTEKVCNFKLIQKVQTLKQIDTSRLTSRSSSKSLRKFMTVSSSKVTSPLNVSRNSMIQQDFNLVKKQQSQQQNKNLNRNRNNNSSSLHKTSTSSPFKIYQKSNKQIYTISKNNQMTSHKRIISKLKSPDIGRRQKSNSSKVIK